MEWWKDCCNVETLFSSFLSINKEGFALGLALISGQTHFGLLLRVKVSQVGCPGVPHRSQYLRPKDCDSELHCRAAVWNAGKSP